MLGLSGDLSLSADDRRNLAHLAVGGVILFARNFAAPAQLRQLTADIRRAAGRKIIIAADQEGGRVQRFCGGGFSPLPPMLRLGDADDLSLLRDAGAVMAAELLAAGVDLSFAPVLDLARGRSQIIGDRAFAADGETAAARALAFADGMRAAGMASCGKHFPGHGYARADSHKTLPADGRAFQDIAASDLIPFARWAAQNMPALMTAHIVYSACDKTAATFSPFWLKEILRKKLGFRGMAVSDDLCMAGADIGGMGERIAAALRAGNDGALICLPEGVEEAIAAVKSAGAKNPWLALSPAAENKICAGDAEYKKARKRLEEFC